MSAVFLLLFVGLVIFGVYRSANFSQRPFVLNFKRGAAWFAAALVFLLALLSFVTVEAGSIGVVKRMGKPVAELMPGAHFVMPFVDTVTPVIVQTRIVKPNEDASSRDLQVVHTEVTLAYHVDPRYATNVLVNLNDDAENRVIAPAILEAIKATTAQYDVQELIAKRPEVRDKIEEFVKARLAPYNIVAETTSITDFRFSKEYEDAIEAKVTAEQNADKAKNDLVRISTEAEQKVAQAKGEAEALRLQKEQITPELLQLRTIEMMQSRWDGHLPENYYGGSAPLPMVDVFKKVGK
jgi:prohibitin 2